MDHFVWMMLEQYEGKVPDAVDGYLPLFLLICFVMMSSAEVFFDDVNMLVVSTSFTTHDHTRVYGQEQKKELLYEVSGAEGVSLFYCS